MLSDVLSPTALKQLRGRFTAAAEAKVDELLERKSFDAIADLAEAYPDWYRLLVAYYRQDPLNANT